MPMTPDEFAAKVDSEGGIADAIFGYGLTADDLDDSDPVLKDAVRHFQEVAKEPLDRLEQAMQRYGE